jgi:hypothetical protein
MEKNEILLADSELDYTFHRTRVVLYTPTSKALWGIPQEM